MIAEVHAARGTDISDEAQLRTGSAMPIASFSYPASQRLFILKDIAVRRVPERSRRNTSLPSMVCLCLFVLA